VGLPLVLLTAAGLSFLVNLILTPLILFVSHRNNWYDELDDRKIHTDQTPRLGGVGFFWAFLFSVFLFALFLPRAFPELSDFKFLSNKYLLMLAGFLVVHLLGLIDDFKNIRAVYKLIGQIIAGSMIAIGGALIDGIYIPLTGWIIPLGPLSGAVTIFWLISISNALNFIDGLDGLAGGIAAIASAAIGTVHLMLGNYVGAVFSFLFFGAMVAFFLFNKPKAKLFMGDGGSLFIGFALGALAFIGAGENPGGDGPQFLAGFILTITVLAVPIIDMVAAILRRIRKRKPVHHADQEHLHHKLLKFGFSAWQILGIIHGGNLVLAGAVIAWGYTRRTGNNLIAGDLLIIASWIFAAVLFTWLHYANRRRIARESASRPGNTTD
jgi:UDP-GlcNAc:undecaprenyl-phosphate GlcNAc-1-phosphate transferase